MTDFFLRIFEFLRRHKWIRAAAFCLLLAGLALQAVRLTYGEDITDFLPLDPNYRKSMEVYQNINAADKIFVVFELTDTAATDPGRLAEAIDIFSEEAARRDPALAPSITAKADYEAITRTADFVYRNIPYFLTESDYARMDSLMTEQAIAEQLERDKLTLMFPVAGMLTANVERDPLNLFTPAAARLRNFRADIRYELYDDHIFSPDFKQGIAIVSSPFGANETSHNADLVAIIDEAAKAAEHARPGISVHQIGAPAIAVANADRIKTDSVYAIAIAALLIIALLVYSFRNLRSLLLIAAAIAFGWLFAVGLLASVRESVSIIVLGIGSVMIGIAVNYPLHFVAHLKHSPDVKSTLKELVAPLLIGNITTVGAFLALVPLDSVALRDLGLFSSFMLIGTILFVLVFLPQIARRRAAVESAGRLTFGRLSRARLERKRWIVAALCVLTAVFGYFSMSTSFDSDMQHINYMTDTQRADLARLKALSGNADSTRIVHVASEGGTWDEALERSEKAQSALDGMVSSGDAISRLSATRFLPSAAEQRRRIARWNRFLQEHGDMLGAYFKKEAAAQGFSPDAFAAFDTILSVRRVPQDFSYFRPLAESLFAGFISDSESGKTIVDALTVDARKTDAVRAKLSETLPGHYAFDVAHLNSAISNSLSSEFNYIGWACGLIVFVFLWLSFGRIELGIVAFLPMIVGWIWILGIMQMADIRFNIVNVILATFIFGQGDDYSIFMTEGMMHEYAYRRKILASYKSSIIISALIMFIGIGSLIIARHPALRSLAEVTIVGMFSVVLMAYLIPPLAFSWLTRRKGQPRDIPVTAGIVLRTAFAATVYLLEVLSGVILGFLLFKLMRKNESRRLFYHRCMYHYFRMNIRHIPGVEFELRNPRGEKFDRPAIVICNHQSMLDPMCFMMLTPKILVGTGEHVWKNRIIHRVLRFSDFFTVADGVGTVLDKCRERLNAGYSIAVYPEGERSADGSILRFHSGAFYLAEQMGADVLPLFIHGMSDVMPKSSAWCFRGKITVEVGRRISPSDTEMGATYQERTKAVRHLYETHFSQMRDQIETARYFRHYVGYKYIYKGASVERSVRRELRRLDCYSRWVDSCDKDGSRPIVVVNNGWGAAGLLFALVCRRRRVVACEADADRRALAASCSRLPANLTITDPAALAEPLLKEAEVFVVSPSEADRSRYAPYSPTFIE